MQRRQKYQLMDVWIIAKTALTAEAAAAEAAAQVKAAADAVLHYQITQFAIGQDGHYWVLG